ncbi:hypothetical protein P8S55_03180 [Halomonas sp. M1]|uniref:hypothetical protein n=1 Tax=Halomonas sp. M1 TaxID=3035470 RepID=UPI002485A132|nr:hypothetical protein [Halomonas sp. M1]WFE72098.1 hypothetical protein P8S55_03180 [Halomonas sp. M1]
MSNETDDLLTKRRSRRQVLARLGLGAAALYVAPTLLSLNQAEARDYRRSRPRYSRPSYSRPSYSRPSYSRPSYSRPRHKRSRYSRYDRPRPSRFDSGGVIEIRLSRLLPRW